MVEPGGEGCLTIVFLDSMSYDMGRRPTVIGQLEQLVQANYGKSIYFKTRLAGRGERLDTIYVTKEDLEDKIEDTTGFHVLDHELKFYGQCSECRKKQK